MLQIGLSKFVFDFLNCVQGLKIEGLGGRSPLLLNPLVKTHDNSGPMSLSKVLIKQLEHPFPVICFFFKADLDLDFHFQ